VGPQRPPHTRLARCALATKCFLAHFYFLETRGSLTGHLNYLEWTITRRAVAEYGGNKSHAAKIF
jgi:hypothetical protein